MNKLTLHGPFFKRIEFNPKTMEAAYARSGGFCECGCGLPFGGRRPEYHHRIEAALGGTNELSNCLVLLPACHRTITSEHSMPVIAKVRRTRRKSIGAVSKPYRKLQSRPFPKPRYAEVEDAE